MHRAFDTAAPRAPGTPDRAASAGRRRALAVAGGVALLLVFAGAQSRALRRFRHDTLTRSTTYSAETPPLLTFATVALSGFRGVIGDLLWLRAARLQETGRHVELVQLADWITALDPHNGEVWAYHAWNLAYNVSVRMTRPEDRWRWVHTGIALLRDNGVRLSPADARVRRELAWIFQHKLGTDMDTAANHYRTEWAREIATYLEPDGSPPADGSLNAAELPETLGLDPAAMRAIDRRFGGLDWRMPCSHAVYWGYSAIPLATERDLLPSRRVVYQSLIMMIRGDGRLEGDPTDEDFVFRARPNEALLDPTVAFLEEVNTAHHFHGVRMALTGLLLDGVRIDARQGREAAARTKHARAVALFRNPAGVPPFEAFVGGQAEVDWSLFRDDE